MEKIKAIDPKIVVSGSADKPYYSIEYYNISDERWHIGYGSYSLKFVKEWLNNDFEIVEADVTPVVRCKDCKYAQYWYGNDKLGNETFLCYFLTEEGIKMFADDFCSRSERRE